MKYKDPITGELKDIIVKSGDTLPIGTIVEFDGETIPDGYEEFETEDYGSLGNIIVDDVTCKNMFNKNTAIDGYALLSATGELNKIDGWCASEYIPVKAGDKITISGKDSAGSGNCFYDVNKNFLQTITAISGTITVPDNASYLRVNLKLEDKDTCQIEKGSVATDYVEHKEFSNKETKSVNLWSGRVYESGSILTLRKPLEIGKIYIIEFYGLSGLYKSYETFIYTGNKYVQLNYYSSPDSVGFRYRLECEGNTITISNESVGATNNTAITNVFEITS